VSETLSLDTYQLTTLVSHFDAGRIDHRLSMAFFFRKLPRNRRFVLACGLRQALAHSSRMHFDPADLGALRAHPLLGPAFAARPGLFARLESLDGFEGDVDAMPEGTPAFAGKARRTDGTPFSVLDTPVTLYTPLAQARTDLLRAKLIETPWLSSFNHGCMVASKAARVVIAADGRPVLEFGQRRTHRDAAVDATYAAWVAGCAARRTSAPGRPTASPPSARWTTSRSRPPRRPARPSPRRSRRPSRRSTQRSRRPARCSWTPMTPCAA
jgi:nicotinate phosphoribosyltransferase